MGDAPCIPRQYTTAPNATPSVPAGLKTVRLAGFRRLHPIVPDRTAFGAAIEGDTHGDHAENQCQAPEHGRPTPCQPYHTALSRAFSSREERAPISANCTLECS